MVKRQRTAFPPNFVHSLDGSHMMMTAVACKKAGLHFAGLSRIPSSLLPPLCITYFTNRCTYSCLYSYFHNKILMFGSRSPRFILDACMRCWWNEQNTEGKVCWTLRGSNTRRCKVTYLVEVLQLWWEFTYLLFSSSLVLCLCYLVLISGFLLWFHWVMSRLLVSHSLSFWFLQLLESFHKSFPDLTFPPLPERGDFDLRDVLKSPYFFN